MPRKKLIRQSSFPYHVTTRTNNKDWFKIPLCDVWDYSKEAIIYANSKCPAVIHSYVLMSNHYHLLISTPNNDIDRFMMHFNKKLSVLINKHSGVINHKFSNRYKWTIVADNNYLLNVYRYIFQNPVRANIVKDIFHYPYSSIHFSRFECNQLNCRPHFKWQKEKYWLSKQYGDDFDNIIRKGLKHNFFKPHNQMSKFNKTKLTNPKSL